MNKLIILLIFFSYSFYSCQDILLNFASMDNFMVHKDSVNSYYTTNYNSDVELKLASKKSIESVWQKGGFPIIYIIDNNGMKINSDDCYASFDQFVFATTIPDGFKEYEKSNLTAHDVNILDEQLLFIKENSEYDYYIFYFWSYLFDHKLNKDSLSYGIFFKTFNQGQFILDSLNANDKTIILPVNVDFVSENWDKKEIRRIIKKSSLDQ